MAMGDPGPCQGPRREREVRIDPDPAQTGSRLDVCLAAHVPDLSRTEAGRLAQSGRVTLHGRPVKASYRIAPGDQFLLRLPAPAHDDIQAEPVPLSVLWEDESLLVIDKARGMVVHPAPGRFDGTLVNALLARGHPLSTVGGADRPGIVHRLDRHTSGVLVVAKDDETHHALKSQLAGRAIEKEYLAITNGTPESPEGVVQTGIDRHPVNRKKMAVVESGGREALTTYRVEERLDPFGLVRAMPRTGRTHQIRVHLAHLGCPVVGDVVYGGRRRAENWARQHRDAGLTALLESLSGQALHSQCLAFRHPRSGRWMAFEAPLPPDMAALLAHLRERPDPG
jgi:23S rRNA pseudouridine1911/1915/1917 synthase